MLEHLEIRSTAPVPGWEYDWTAGEATYAVDPRHPGNARITDLDLAPRDPDGLVRFRGDVVLLRPTHGGNHRAVLSVCNRGAVSIPFRSAMTAHGVAGVPDLVDTMLLEQGWSIAWGGWQWDVDRSSRLAGLDAPTLRVEPGLMRSEFFISTVTEELRLADQYPLAHFAGYPTFDLDDPDAVLTMRTAQLGARVQVPRRQWRFTSPDTFAVDGGFQPFHYYELFYRSTSAPVVGAGLLAIRDLGASLRRCHDHVLAIGVSQTGRFLREFVHAGLNLDEQGRQVFDGLFINIASARRGEFNRRFAQPSLLHPLMPEYGPPYDSASLLERQRTVGGVPKIMITNSASEYWRGDGALVHQDAVTGADLPEDPDVRAHLVSGTDHIGPLGAFKSSLPVANPVHHLDPSPVLRALFVQLNQWACDGIAPSPSRVPRTADGTLARREEVLARFREAAAIPDPAALPYTPDIDSRQTSWPLQLGDPRVALVSTVDQVGNEIAGIRLPEVEVGIAAFTGWNPRRHVDGLPDVLLDLTGSRLTGLDGPACPDIEAAVRAATRRLVSDRLLLERDVDHVIARALSELKESGATDPSG